jgi:glycosyltransferase involved in cell wall biosynthesis
MGVTTEAPHRVSVIVPACDRPVLLRQALASIRAIEGIDLTCEILVGDNGSDPETATVAKEFDATHIKVSTRGPSAARNAGLRAATGEYVAFLDDDDVWLPEAVRPQIASLKLNPSLNAVICQAVYSDQNLTPIGPPWPEEVSSDRNEQLRTLLSGFFPQIGTVLVRTTVRNIVGEFDESLIGGEDLDWLLRIARRSSLGFVAIPGLLFRLKPQGSYDAVQRDRIAYDRRVFFRYALPEWRIWRSPLDFSRAYSKTLWHFYQYFMDAAIERVARGERYSALRAIAATFSVFPVRATYHLFFRPAFRRAFFTAILPPWRHSQRSDLSTL